MMDLITGLLGSGGGTGIWGVVSLVVAAVGGAVLLIVKIVSGAKAKMRLKQAEATIETLRADKASDTKIERETDAEILARISKPRT